MPTNQFDIFDLVVNIVPPFFLTALVSPLFPPALIDALGSLEGLELTGVGVVGFVVAYGFGELLYGLAKEPKRVNRLRGRMTALLRRLGYIDSPPEDFDRPFWQYHWVQTYLERAVEGEAEPFQYPEVASNLLERSAEEFDVEFLEKQRNGGLKTKHLDQFYYLTESHIYDENTLFGEFQIQSQLFLTLWFASTVALALLLVSTVTGVIGAYEPVWMTRSNGSPAIFTLLTLSYAFLVVLTLRLFVSTRARQVKRFIFDAYVHL